MNDKALAIAALSLAFAAVSQAHPSSLTGATTPNLKSSKVYGPISSNLYSGLVWRNIGPFRGGRVSAVSGAIGQPGVYYAGTPNGGLFKSTNAGTSWEQIFDDIKDASSIGAVQVAPSDPNIVYVGLGDGTTGRNEGNGMYRSSDGGKTWTHIGLDFAMQIPSIAVDPKDPNTLIAGVLGNFKKASSERGGYRSTDGGKSWTKTLVTNNITGVQNIAYAYDTPNVMLATTARHCSVGLGDKDTSAPNSFNGTKIVKSEDGGKTWKQVKGEGLPDSLGGRTCVAVAMNTQGKRMFYVSNSGLWRSDDGGDSWKQMAKDDNRIRNGQGGYNCGVSVNTKDPDTVYVLNTCSYISHDGGKTFTGFKGAPGGDDPQQIWMDPTDSNRIFFGVDQGPAITLDGGRTWSTWYNIANGQFYHIAVSNSWPYWCYATMQDSGCIGISSRGIYGEITPLDWSPNPGWEWGSITVDPLNPNILYSTGQTNDVIRQSFPTGQWISVSPDNDPKLKLRHDFNQPIMFSPVNPHELFLGYQFLMSSIDGGKTWHKLGPDLSYPANYVPPKPEVEKKETKKPAKKAASAKKDTPPKKANEREPDHDRFEADSDNDGDQNISRKDAMERMQEMSDEEMQRGGGGGAIASLSPSSIDGGIIWAGMSNGTIKLTKDHGKTWSDMNVPGNKKSIVCIDASHTDPASAYVVISNDPEPAVYRTTNFGQSWSKIVHGLPTDEVTGSKANVVRADTKKDGLLFLGTDSSMYVSFDDGDHWQSLRLNAPNTSYRDIVVKDNDLVVGTYGRSFWILDDISPLRQVSSDLGSTFLFAPGDAVRARRNVNQDTPMPPEVPHALNAPPGALVYYYLGSKPNSDITLDVTDSAGKLIRHYTSAPFPEVKEPLQPIPDFWKEVPKPMPTEIGTNRINWDLRYENPPANSRGYDISATPYLTPLSPQGPLVLPGVYNLTLTVDGKKSVQKVTVKNDPRSPASSRDLQIQHAAQMDLMSTDTTAMAGSKALAALKAKVTEIENGKIPSDISKALDDLVDKLDNLGGPNSPSFSRIQNQSLGAFAKMEFGDLAPSQPVQTTINSMVQDLKKLVTAWKKIQSKDLKSVNAALKKANLPELSMPDLP